MQSGRFPFTTTDFVSKPIEQSNSAGRVSGGQSAVSVERAKSNEKISVSKRPFSDFHSAFF
eukprot:m.11782 g.11782  ORF g.11782 m.11782 type:complete len:61 (-) comp4472_c0_seq2:90-272(-)